MYITILKLKTKLTKFNLKLHVPYLHNINSLQFIFQMN